MKTYLMTRGTARSFDYHFLATTPPNRWWEERLVNPGLIITTRPELAVEGRDGSAGIVLFNLSSRRRDEIGTAIRYTLVVEDLNTEPVLAAWLIDSGLRKDRRDQIAALLDSVCTAEVVDAMLATNAKDQQILTRVSRLLLDQATAEATAAAGSAAPAARVALAVRAAADGDVPRPWTGSARDTPAKAAFAAYARGLATGRTGLCFTSHALDTRDAAQRAVRELASDEVVVLMADSAADGIQRLAGTTVSIQGKASAEPRWRLLVSALLGLILIALILWLL